LEDGIHDRNFLRSHCSGFDRFEAYVRGITDSTPKTTAWAEDMCGDPAHDIRTLAKQAASTRTMMTCTWSLQRAHRGEQPYWTIIALAAALGQIGLPGGGFAFGHGSMNGAGNPRMAVAAPEMKGIASKGTSSIPVARFA